MNGSLGGKGTALVRLVEAGFSVPKFFVVPASAVVDHEEIADHAKKLGAKKFAVRSSAMIEDGKKHSFAGQFLTLLDVMPKDVVKAIKKVRASGPDMAVIVQEMIHGDESGVAFTANPVTGDRDEMVIESVKGLGEKLVSGKVTPKTEIISKRGRHTGIEKLVLEIEKHFGFPVDVEWTQIGKKVYILQSRPITTL